MFSNSSFKEYKQYHDNSRDIGDIDPSYSMLRYVCKRFDLNMEQRYWLAFLYATCYCGSTVYFIYNEFPDFENVDFDRMERWWKKHKKNLYFQTDKKWIRSKNQFVDVCRSYKKKIGNGTQEDKFKSFFDANGFIFYENAWKEMSGIYQFGRFAMFLYLESIHVVTGINIKPTTINLDKSEGCRNGLAFALDQPDLVTHGSDKKLTEMERKFLQANFNKMLKYMVEENPGNNVCNIETTLYSYKKYRLGKRWVGYYIERQRKEIEKMQGSVRMGVDWSVLWGYRRETFNHKYLKEVR